MTVFQQTSYGQSGRFASGKHRSLQTHVHGHPVDLIIVSLTTYLNKRKNIRKIKKISKHYIRRKYVVQIFRC